MRAAKWRPAPAGSRLCFDNLPLCVPVAAYARVGEDTLVLTEAGQIMLVDRHHNDRFVLGGEVRRA